jgi:hypothetical protein
MTPLAEKLWADVQERLGDHWAELESDAQIDVHAAVKDLADLMARAAMGEDVTQAQAEVRATISNWGWVGASHARSAIAAALAEAAKFLAALAAAFVKGLM